MLKNLLFITILNLLSSIAVPSIIPADTIDICGQKIILHNTTKNREGKIIKGYLAKDTDLYIADNKLKIRSGKIINLYDSGFIKDAYLANNVKIKLGNFEYEFLANTAIEISEEGNIESGYFAKPTEIIKGEKKCTASYAYFNNDGTVRFIYFPYPTKLKIGNDTFTIRNNYRTFIDEMGNIDLTAIADEKNITILNNNFTILPGEIRFYSTGNINYIANFLPTKINIDNNIYPTKSDIYFHENGTPEKIKLSEDITINVNDKLYELKAYESSETRYVVFSENGKFLRQSGW